MDQTRTDTGNTSLLATKFAVPHVRPDLVSRPHLIERLNRGTDAVLGLREVRRVLKPGGRFVMLEHVRAPGLLGPVFDLLNPLVVRLNGANINRRTVENVRLAGFEIESVESRARGIVKLIVARK